MTQTEMLARIRVILNESAGTGGYWQDTDIYRAIDSGQNAVISFLLAKRRLLAIQNVDFYSNSLNCIVTLDTSNTTTTGSGYQEYSVASTYLETYYAEYSATTAGVKYACAILPFVEAVKRGKNSFANSVTSPIVYNRGEKIGFFPQPISGGSNNYIHYYYAQPTPIDSTHDFTLREETHEAIEEYALYLSLEKDKAVEATQHLQNFINKVTNL